ncbi:hypothetical protein PS627_02525 [Pseudomonas fluorescens]|uniref:REP-associated tyrosine transposase n=1 Tax=Pseudomonas fluorescens TaxID=294 RepID=UPI0012544D55|nr:transposase [Pseudomonas fluorescens]CAG8867509.1 hypothetical protein PS627_02525 [Pseudomonas fluorescens]VVP92063.1 hypothetical protein PS910_02970 [Pseudomonas fluorescens]
MERPNSHLLRRGRVSEPGRIYLLTTVTRDRIPFFTTLPMARTVIQQMRQADRENACRSLAWVVMPDHVHWMIELQDSTLCSLMRRFKSRSSCALYKTGNVQGRIWQQGYQDEALRRDQNALTAARHIIATPLRAGLAEHVGDYPHWDCVWL